MKNCFKDWSQSNSFLGACFCLLQVFWLKDGQQIDVKGDINFIISSEGSLIINQARLLDTGNYTCGAQNIVTRRLSHTVTLTVFGMYNVVMKSDTMYC